MSTYEDVQMSIDEKWKILIRTQTTADIVSSSLFKEKSKKAFLVTFCPFSLLLLYIVSLLLTWMLFFHFLIY